MNEPHPSPSRLPSRALRWAVFLGLTATITAVDLWTKEWSFELLDVVTRGDPPTIVRQRVVEVIPHWFDLQATYNRGAFSGWFGSHTEVLTLLSFVASLVILGIVGFSIHRSRPPAVWFYVALGLICGGTVGNLYDRYTIGAVRDWIKWFVVIDGEEHVWPNFNIADSGICVGVGLIVLLEIIRAVEDRRESRAQRGD